MTTLKKINEEAVSAIKKASKGQRLTREESEVIAIYNRLNGGKAGNAGKRKTIKTGR